MLINLLIWAVIGLVAGWLAGEFTKGSGYGLVGNIIVGLIGALVGGFLAGALFGVDATTGFNITTVLTAFVGAVIFVSVLSFLGRANT